MPLEFGRWPPSIKVSSYNNFVKNVSFDEVHKKKTVIFYGLPVVCNILLWYPDANIRRGPPLRYKAYDLRGRPHRGLPLSAYRERR